MIVCVSTCYISAGKHAQLKPILMTLVKIQRVPVKK